VNTLSLCRTQAARPALAFQDHVAHAGAAGVGSWCRLYPRASLGAIDPVYTDPQCRPCGPRRGEHGHRATAPMEPGRRARNHAATPQQ